VSVAETWPGAATCLAGSGGPALPASRGRRVGLGDGIERDMKLGAADVDTLKALVALVDDGRGFRTGEAVAYLTAARRYG
jgi:hypothetical protein